MSTEGLYPHVRNFGQPKSVQLAGMLCERKLPHRSLQLLFCRERNVRFSNERQEADICLLRVYKTADHKDYRVYAVNIRKYLR